MAKTKELDGVPGLVAAAVKAELKLGREDIARTIIEDFG